jgi:hypothetical protein
MRHEYELNRGSGAAGADPVDLSAYCTAVDSIVELHLSLAVIRHGPHESGVFARRSAATTERDHCRDFA